MYQDLYCGVIKRADSESESAQATDKVPSKSDIRQFAQKAESYVSTCYAGVKGAQPPSKETVSS